ncbi:MAG: hypothetical protein QM754_03590 [Tepidisphaeraceae bacterium]
MSDDLTATLHLPDDLLEPLRQRMKQLQFRDVRFYVRWLVAREIAPTSEAANLEMALIEEGLNSGPERDYDEAFKRELIERTDRIIEAKAAMKANRAAG